MNLLELRELLSHSRSLSAVNPDAINLYEPFIDIAKLALSEIKDLSVRFIFIDSLSAKFEQYELNGGHFIVCDTRVFLYLELLNRLTFSKNSSAAGPHYTFAEIAINESLVTGNLEFLQTEELEDFIDMQPPPSDMKKYQFTKDEYLIVLFQSIFMIYHEIGHIVLRRRGKLGLSLLEQSSLIIDAKIDSMQEKNKS